MSVAFASVAVLVIDTDWQGLLVYDSDCIFQDHLPPAVVRNRMMLSCFMVYGFQVVDHIWNFKE